MRREAKVVGKVGIRKEEAVVDSGDQQRPRIGGATGVRKVKRAGAAETGIKKKVPVRQWKIVQVVGGESR